MLHLSVCTLSFVQHCGYYGPLKCHTPAQGARQHASFRICHWWDINGTLHWQLSILSSHIWVINLKLPAEVSKFCYGDRKWQMNLCVHMGLEISVECHCCRNPQIWIRSLEPGILKAFYRSGECFFFWFSLSFFKVQLKHASYCKFIMCSNTEEAAGSLYRGRQSPVRISLLF